MKPATYDLAFYHLGNGLTVCNRAREVGGDFERIAHISAKRAVTYYKRNLPQAVRDQIQAVAEGPNLSASTSQPWLQVFEEATP